jgi:hypothetical protein
MVCFNYLIERPVGTHMPCKKPEPFSSRMQAFGPQLTPATAQKLKEDADRQGAGMMWMVVEEDGCFRALVVTEDGVGSGWLTADSLTGLRQRLPLGIVRSDIQPSETPDIVEVWRAA